MRRIAIIPLRTDSRRLPSKHLRPLGGRPMVQTLVARLHAVPRLDGIVFATTIRGCDDPLAELAERLDLPCFRGAVSDVLGRCAAAARDQKADVVIKANGDSPLLAPEVAARAIEQLQLFGADCVTGKSAFTGLPYGLGVEAITAEALDRLDREVTSPRHREAITSAVFEDGSGFNWAPVITPLEWRVPHLNLCIDTPEDLVRMKALFTALPPRPDAGWPIPEILAAAESLPGLLPPDAQDGDAERAWA